MNMTQVKLNDLKSLGFEIVDTNCDVIATTEKATDYKNKYYSDSKYILGSIPSGNEKLSNVEYDICFQIIENNYNILENDLYGDLHEKAQGNNCLEFMNYIQNLNKNVMSQDFKDGLIEEVSETLQDIIDEMNEILNDLK